MAFKKLSSKVIHANPWSEYKHDTYELIDGQIGDYFYLETRGNAMVIPVLDDGKIALTIQYRYLAGRSSIEFPCGGIIGAESPLSTAERELLEETGYKSSNLIKAGVFEGLNGLVRDASHLFVATELEKVASPSNDAREQIEVIFRRPDEFEIMIKSGEIWDGQTLSAWAIARDLVMRQR